MSVLAPAIGQVPGLLLFPTITQAGAGGGSSFTPISATGGTITDTTIGGRAWRYHTFTASGNFVVSNAGSDGQVEYLIVGGGASGAHHDARVGMGGGAGGMVRSGTFTPVVNTTYGIVIGAGGAGVSGATSGMAGSNTTAFGVTAEGGSGGGGYFTNPGNGVNGGGGGCTVTTGNNPAGGTGTNFAGGTGFGNSNSFFIAGGGGAGAGGPGGSAAYGLGGAGGLGVASTITGASVIYGAGAGGCAATGGSAPTGGVAGVGFDIAPNAGTNGRGNGGSGAAGTGAGVASGAGGTGVFIVGYWTAAA